MGCWVPEDDDRYLSTYMNTTNNTELHCQMMQQYPVRDDSLVYLQCGLLLTFRNDDGSLAYKYGIKGGDSIEGCMYRFMAAFCHGAAIGENECMGFDFSTTYPEGFSFGWGNCLVPDALKYPAFTDRNGVQIFSDENMEKYGYTPEDFITSRATFNRSLAQLKVSGEFEAMDDGSRPWADRLDAR